jgi:hypothetical protein
MSIDTIRPDTNIVSPKIFGCVELANFDMSLRSNCCPSAGAIREALIIDADLVVVASTTAVFVHVCREKHITQRVLGAATCRAL